MTTFDDREMGFEAKYAHDAEMQFRAIGRRNRLLGFWAGGLMGLVGPALEAYAARLIHSELVHPTDDEVIEKLQADLSTAGLKLSRAALGAKLSELHAIARKEVQAAA